MMKILFSVILSSSIVLLSGCVTPLTGVQRCAIKGEYYIGSTSSSHIDPIANTIGKQSVVHYNCRRVKTAEEQKEVDQALPEASALQKENNTQRTLLFAAAFSAIITTFLIALPQNRKK